MAKEYLRRNLLLASAIGAGAGARVALERLRATKRPPKWLIEALEGIQERVEPLPRALSDYRNEAPDKPDQRPGYPQNAGRDGFAAVQQRRDSD